jgi:methylmalonyl-CoA/ethylmalonyl-CoA epimerase
VPDGKGCSRLIGQKIGGNLLPAKSSYFQIRFRSIPLTTSASTALTRVKQIAVVAKNVERATAFYRDVLGLQLLFQAGQLSFFDCGGVRFMLTKAPDDPNHEHPGSLIYFEVADLQATFERLKSAGVKFVDAPHMVGRTPTHEAWMTVFHDSEDNQLALMSEIPIAG